MKLTTYALNALIAFLMGSFFFDHFSLTMTQGLMTYLCGWIILNQAHLQQEPSNDDNNQKEVCKKCKRIKKKN